MVRWIAQDAISLEIHHVFPSSANLGVEEYSSSPSLDSYLVQCLGFAPCMSFARSVRAMHEKPPFRKVVPRRRGKQLVQCSFSGGKMRGYNQVTVHINDGTGRSPKMKERKRNADRLVLHSLIAQGCSGLRTRRAQGLPVAYRFRQVPKLANKDQAVNWLDRMRFRTPVTCAHARETSCPSLT